MSVLEIASKEEIVAFLDKWLVNHKALKFDLKAVELIERLIPHFKYEGKIYRGLYEPFENVQREGVERSIDSWSKTENGIEEIEDLANCVFGSVSVKDGSIHVFSEEEFIKMNDSEEDSYEPFDEVLVEYQIGLDLIKLAEFVDYRADFRSHIQKVEEVLVIRKMD